jgi:hypothetical protein
MDGSAIAPPRQVVRQGYLIVTILLGIAGSLVAMAAFGKGTYRVGPFLVQMSVKPATSGTTEMGIEFAQAGLQGGSAKKETHTGFLALRGAIVGLVGSDLSVEQLAAAKDPFSLATTIRDDGKAAMRKFALRLGLVVLGGGAAGGFAISLVGLKTRRLFQGAIAGVLVVGILGILAWKTYDIDKLNKVSFNSGTPVSQLLNP